MKTLLKASGIGSALAFMSAIGLVGCSAEPLSPEEAADIGVSEQALGASSAEASLSAAAPDQRAVFSSSCAFDDATDSYLVKAGGFTAIPAATAKIVLQKNGGAWVDQTAALSVARGQSQAFQIDSTHCVIIGGSTVQDAAGGAASVKVDLLTLDTSVTPRIVLQATLADLNVPRSMFGLSSCKDNNNAIHIVVTGGKDQSAMTPELRDLEVSPTLANITNAANTWTRTANILTAGRFNFGIDTDGSNNYFVAGGRLAGGVTSQINLFKMTTANGVCTPVAAVTPSNNDPLTGAPYSVSVGVEGNVVFYEAGAVNKFHVIAGRTGAPALWADQNTFTATFGAPANVTAKTTTAAPANYTPTYRPSILRIDATKSLLMGGGNAALTASIAKVQEYSGGWASQNLTTGIYGGSAAILPVLGEAWIVAGDSTPGTRGTNTESFSIP